MVETLPVGLLVSSLERPVASLEAWLAGLDARLTEAQAAGARMLVLPEFACFQWLHFAPPGLAPVEQVPWLAGRALEAAPGLSALAVRYGMPLLAGSFPAYAAGAQLPTNQAWLFLPDGTTVVQDKLSLTPSEQAGFVPGDKLRVITWQGLRIAITVCLDIEFTSLWARLGRLNLDLILVPARTSLASGYNRVMGCARARAIELQAVVAVVGATGTPLAHPLADPEFGGAAAFTPCDASLDQEGVAAMLPLQLPGPGISPLLVAPLPVGACRRIRYGGAEAEVWPASWAAEHILIDDSAPLAA